MIPGCPENRPFVMECEVSDDGEGYLLELHAYGPNGEHQVLFSKHCSNEAEYEQAIADIDRATESLAQDQGFSLERQDVT